MAKPDELRTIELETLAQVTGGAGTDMAAMMLPMIMKKKQAAVAPAAPPAASPTWAPKITVDGVPQSLTSTGNDTFAAGGSGDPTATSSTGSGGSF